jgi:putative hydrolase of the HAD superfamily
LITIDWSGIRQVFLDMDGTLLDLHYDNHFWLEHLPLRLAQQRGLDPATVRDELFGRYAAVRGRLEWYCLDYWSRELGVDIVALKREVAHLIDVKAHVPGFLDALRGAGRRVVLLTNAHDASLRLKLEYTGIEGHFDRLISSHGLGEAKESDAFWPRLQTIEPFDRDATLLIDDNLEVLRAARRYGLGRLLAVRFPDSRRGAVDTGEFDAVEDFRAISPAADSGAAP